MKIPLIVGNWKMNLLDSESKELAREIREFSEKIEGEFISAVVDATFEGISDAMINKK